MIQFNANKELARRRHPIASNYSKLEVKITTNPARKKKFGIFTFLSNVMSFSNSLTTTNATTTIKSTTANTTTSIASIDASRKPLVIMKRVIKTKVPHQRWRSINLAINSLFLPLVLRMSSCVNMLTFSIFVVIFTMPLDVVVAVTTRTKLNDNYSNGLIEYKDQTLSHLRSRKQVALLTTTTKDKLLHQFTGTGNKFQTKVRRLTVATYFTNDTPSSSPSITGKPVFLYNNDQTQTLYPSQTLENSENIPSVIYDPYQQTLVQPSACSEVLSCYHLVGSCCPTPDGIFLSCCNEGLATSTTSNSGTSDTFYPVEPTSTPFPTLYPLYPTSIVTNNPTSHRPISTSPITSAPTALRSPSASPVTSAPTGSPTVLRKPPTSKPTNMLPQTYTPTTSAPSITPTTSTVVSPTSFSPTTSTPNTFMPSISPSTTDSLPPTISTSTSPTPSFVTLIPSSFNPEPTIAVSNAIDQPVTSAPSQHFTPTTTSTTPTSSESTEFSNTLAPYSTITTTTIVPTVSDTWTSSVEDTYKYAKITLASPGVLMEFQRSDSIGAGNITRSLQQETTQENDKDTNEINSNDISSTTFKESVNDERCTKLWNSYVQRQIKQAVEQAVPEYETLRVQILNISQSSSNKNDTAVYTFVFDVKIEIRSILTTQQRDLRQYVEGPFDSVKEQDAFVDYLRSTITDCNEYSDFVSVRVIVNGSENTNNKNNAIDNIIDKEEGPSKMSSAQIGLIVSLGIAAFLVLLLMAAFIYYKTRKGHRRNSVSDDEFNDHTYDRKSQQEMAHTNNYVKEIGFRQKSSTDDHLNYLMCSSQEISTLGDPIPQRINRYNNNGVNGGADDMSTLESNCVEYDYQKAFIAPAARDRSESNASALTGTIAGDTDDEEDDGIKTVFDSNNRQRNPKSQSVKSILDVGGTGNTEDDNDDDVSYGNVMLKNSAATSNPNTKQHSLDPQQKGNVCPQEEQFEVLAPSGVLGLIVESSKTSAGFPVVHSIKKGSILSGVVHEGDRIVSLDGIDVSNLMAGDASKLIASKKDQPVRRFIFSRQIMQGVSS